MSRLTGPLFSLAASGTIAETLTYSSWKGVPYVRTRVVPNNPNTANQQEVRGIFASLSDIWNRAPQLFRDPWQAAVRAAALTDRNRLVQENVPALQGDVNADNMVMSVGSGGAVDMDNVVETPGVGTIDFTADAPTAPIGYTFVGLIASIMADGDLSTIISRIIQSIEDNATPYTAAFTDLTAGIFQTLAVAHFTRDSDSLDFYSGGVRDQTTVT